MKGVVEEILREASNEVRYASESIEEVKVMLTPAYRLMAPGRSEDLHHLTVVLLRYRQTQEKFSIPSLCLTSVKGVLT